MAPSPLVRPFAGLRYARTDLGSVLAPPYDVITSDDLQQLLSRDPHNVVRLELNYGVRGEAGGEDRYAEAANTLQTWRQQGIMRYDDGPCLYPCAHEFTLYGEKLTRVGVLCAVRLSPFAKGSVLPHEGTLRGPREDRRLLMLACHAQTSPILALHDDAAGEGTTLIEAMMREPPEAHAEMGDDRLSLWRRPAPHEERGRKDDVTERYCRLVGKGPLFIADGHHRYETALAVSSELRQAYPDAPGQAAFDYVLTLLCSAQQPGVVILPTHRLLRLQSPQEWERLEQLVERHFVRRTVECNTADAQAAAQAIRRWLKQADDGVHFGMYTRSGGCVLLSAKSRSIPADPGPGGYNELATVLSQRLLLEPLLGVEAVAERVDYASDEAEALWRVREGEFECALFLRPTRVAQVQSVAAAGLRMPGKSTYFYPKAPAGLVLHDISPDRAIA